MNTQIINDAIEAYYENNKDIGAIYSYLMEMEYILTEYEQHYISFRISSAYKNKKNSNNYVTESDIRQFEIVRRLSLANLRLLEINNDGSCSARINFPNIEKEELIKIFGYITDENGKEIY